MMLMPCPCCHGEKFLFVFEQEREGQKYPREPHKTMCCHCQGEGEIESELCPPLQNPLGPIAGHSEFVNELQELAARQAKRKPILWIETWKSCFRWRP
jgi:hypothetical protein